MYKEKMLLPISIICLAGSIVFGSWQISNGIQVASMELSGQIQKSIEKGQPLENRTEVMDLDSAAKYLNIEASQLEKMCEGQEPVIPYIRTGNTYLFSRTVINQWLVENPWITID